MCNAQAIGHSAPRLKLERARACIIMHSPRPRQATWGVEADSLPLVRHYKLVLRTRKLDSERPSDCRAQCLSPSGSQGAFRPALGFQVYLSSIHQKRLPGSLTGRTRIKSIYLQRPHPVHVKAVNERHFRVVSCQGELLILTCSCDRETIMD